MKTDKIISVKLKSFSLIGYLMLGLGLVYSASLIIGADPHSPKFADGVTGGAIAIAAGCTLLIMGNKKRTFKILEDRVEYWASKLIFSAKYEDIEVLKTYHEGERKSSYLAIVASEERLLTVSSAYFEPEKLAEVFNELSERVAGIDTALVEDDLNWLKKL